MLEAEYGSSHPVAMFKSVAMVDSEGNEVPYPLCEKCGTGKTFLIGSQSHVSICMNCDNEPKPKDVLTKVFLTI